MLNVTHEMLYMTTRDRVSLLYADEAELYIPIKPGTMA